MPLTSLRGHREIADRLLTELRNRPSHAYLFSGPRGVGKALVATSLVHALRCDCCSACVQIATGVHPDFTYVSRPVGRTDVLIEQVRELIVRLGTRPARGTIRIAIIDDAETLNIPAQNALLKTLEEPPGHAIIIMVTSSERALLDTVRSRTRTVRFPALQVADLEAIVAARGVDDKARA